MKLQGGEDFSEIWPDIERTLAPMMRGMSRSFARSLGIDDDDAYQEARLALYEAFQHYDYNKSQGGIRRYARTALRNAFCGMLYSATTQSRQPHTVYEDDDGETKIARHRLASIDDISEEGDIFDVEASDPETESVQRQLARRLGALRLKLYRGLAPRERAVFRAKSAPSEDFALFLRNVDAEEPTNELIARYLGISKNGVDWSLHKIRRDFARLAERTEFSDLIEGLIREGSWPMIHVSRRANDVEFVRQTIQSRRLDPRPLPVRRDIRKSGDSARIVEHYHWGVVVFLVHRGEVATVVIEGRFNALQGEVFGEHGIWKSIGDELPWYKALSRELNRP